MVVARTFHGKANINDFLEKIEPEDVVKDYLSVEELYCLVETPCKIPVLKTASLFSCLTSLRLSDILTLCWEEIVDFAAGGKCVHTITQKTKTEDIIPISDEALKLIAIENFQESSECGPVSGRRVSCNISIPF